MKDGHLKLVPTAGTQTPGSSVQIVDGQYRLANRGGVAVGTYRVEITAFHTLPPAPENHDVDSTGIREQYLPERFNVNSKIELTVPSGARQIQHDFHLQP